MIFDHDIICIDRHGKPGNFKYSMEQEFNSSEKKEEIIFRIVPFDSDQTNWFEITIIKISATVGKIASMTHNYMEECRAKGIPDKIIEEANKLLGLDIISSTNNREFQLLDTESRTIDGTKVWKRLMNAGKAKHDQNTDIYTFIPSLAEM